MNFFQFVVILITKKLIFIYVNLELRNSRNVLRFSYDYLCSENLIQKDAQNVLLSFLWNGTACFKNVYDCLNTNNYSYLEISGGQSSYLYLNMVHFFNTTVYQTSVTA